MVYSGAGRERLEIIETRGAPLNQGGVGMLFCITANYTPKALAAMRESPNTDRGAALQQLVSAAGGKVLGFYYTTAEGPGAQAIIDVDPVSAAAITSTIASSDGTQNVKMMRLWSQDEVVAIRKKRVELHKAYKPPA
jgi:uncharacterized protein with GYD domain